METMTNLISIVMPNYNCARFLKSTIESVKCQTYSNWEILFVDDCSTDNSLDIINEYAKEDLRIRVFKNDKNSGAAFSRNKALREAKGKWIAFLDSDDIWVKDKLEKQIKFMGENNCHFSYTRYKEIDEDSNEMGVEVFGPKKISKHKMFNYCYPGCLTVMYDKDYIGLVQIENSLMKNNDYAIWLKVCRKANCYLLNECLSFYRKRTKSISSGSKLSLIKYHYVLYKEGERFNSLHSYYQTFVNLFHGVFKKIRFVKKYKINK